MRIFTLTLPRKITVLVVVSLLLGLVASAFTPFGQRVAAHYLPLPSFARLAAPLPVPMSGTLTVTKTADTKRAAITTAASGYPSWPVNPTPLGLFTTPARMTSFDTSKLTASAGPPTLGMFGAAFHGSVEKVPRVDALWSYRDFGTALSAWLTPNWTTRTVVVVPKNPSLLATLLVINADDSGAGSLRAAIQQANATNGDDTITFDSSFNTARTINLTSGGLLIENGTGISGSITIQGPGADLLTINGPGNKRVFTITNVTTAISGLTIRGGRSSASSGGDVTGGGVLTESPLTMTNCVVTGNYADYAGGGIHLEAAGASLSLDGCTVSGNSTDTTNNQRGYGGGIMTWRGVTLKNTTIANNTSYYGGGIWLDTSPATLINTTISGNTSAFGGGILANGSPAVITATNTIVSGNNGSGNVYLFGGAPAVTGSNNFINGNALLAALGNYGGRTPTMPPLPGSPAINGGVNTTGVPTVDQRGVSRVGNVDIGAVESRGFTLAVNGGNNQSTIPTTAFANPLAVTVSSGFGEPVQGGLVTFTAPGSGPSATLTSPAALNASGQTSVNATANATAGGPYQVTASANGLTTGSFNLSNTCPTFTVGTPTATGTLGLAYSSSAAATPAVSAPLNYRYSLTNSTTLPAGLSLNPNTGAITGTPTATGNVSFDIRAQLFNDNTATGCAVTVQRSINITCVTDPVVTSAADSGTGSLREAIAIACPGSTITFASPLFDMAQEIQINGQLVIDKSLTINGRGANLTTVRNVAAASGTSRVFQINSGTVNLAGLTITGGNLTGGVAIPICNTTVNACGGGISNVGNLTITNSVISGNSINASGAFGGGIINGGTLTITNSTVSNNSANASVSEGGGIYNYTGAVLNITNSTISGNSAGGGTNASGGGITNSGAGILTIINGTVSNNSVNASNFRSGGGILTSGSSTFNAHNTIITGNSAAISPNLGGNLSGSSTNNLVGGDARLLPLGNYGGTTPTHALSPDSPAINAGNNCVLTANGCGNNHPALATDQRGTGFNRQIGGTVDIGAFEANYALAATGGSGQSTTVNTAFAHPLVATLTESGNPVSNVLLTFTAPGSGPSATFPNGNTATTNASGQVSVNVAANTLSGSAYTVTANTTPGLATAASFNLTNTCPSFTLGTPTGTGGLGVAYSSSVAATPAVSAPLNYRYSLANSTTLPPGLSLNPTTGAITGTPTATGNVSFDLKAELFNDNTATGCAVTVQRSINITCVTDPVVTSAADSGTGSLREAIAIACPGSTITFANGISLITLTSGELVINKNLTIQGPGANVLTIRQTATNSRVLQITNGNVNLTGMTLTGGNTSSLGGAIFASQFNFSILITLTGIHVTGNTADGAPGILCAFNCNLNLLGSTVSGNTATSGGNFHGGGVKIGVGNGQGTLKIINSTISGNRVNGSSNSAGGVMIDGISTAVIINSTITDNEVPPGDGSNASGVRTVNTNTTVRNSIIAGNRNNANVPDVTAFGSFTSNGNNIIGSAPAGIGFTNGEKNDQVGSIANPLDAKLATLGNNGGPTQTHALSPDSPAINAGNNCVLTANGCGTNDPPTGLTTDQRGAGFARKVGAHVDIGAFEANYALAATGGSGQSTTVNTAFAHPLVATLTESGNPVSNVLLTFTAPGSGPSATFPNGNTATTNASGQASVNVAANAISGSAYTVTANTTPGLATAASFSLTNTCPTINAQVSGGGAICPTGTAQVSVNVSGGTAPYSVTLNNGGGTLMGSGPFIFNVSPSSTTTYSVQSATDANGCPVMTSGSALVTVNALPATPTISGNLSFCSNGSTTLTATGSGTFMWFKNNTLIPGQSTNMLTVLEAGSYTVKVTDANSCASATSQPAVVSVNPLPAAPTISGTLSFCQGSGTTLTASGTGTFMWFKDNTPISGQTTNTLNVTSAGSYTVKVTDGNSCASATSQAAIVSVNALPATPTISGNLSFCSNGSTTLTATGSGTFMWFKNNTLIPGQSTNMLTVLEAGSYTVKVTDANSCASATSQPAVVSVKPTPVVNPATPAAICSGTQTNIVLGSTPSGATFNWTASLHSGSVSGFSNSSGGTIAQTLTGNGVVKYTVTATLDGCPSAPVEILQTVKPTPVVTPVSPAAICSGAQTNIVLGSTPSGATFSWTASLHSGTVTGFSNSSGGTIAQTLTGNGVVKYIVTATLDGCPSAPVEILQTVKPTPVVTPATPAAICSGAQTNIVLGSTPSGATFNWTASLQSGSVSGFSNSSGSTIAQTLTGNGVVKYTVTATLNGCPSAPVDILQTVNALTSTAALTARTVCEGAPVSFSTTASGTGPFSFVWKKGATVLTNGGNLTITTNGATSTLALAAAAVADAGSYSVEVTGACNTVTQTAALTVNTLPTISDPTSVNLLQGGTASFSVTPTGTPTPSVQWQVSTDGGNTFADIPSATSTTLSLPNVTPAMNGYRYRAIAANSCGTATSRAATLSVSPYGANFTDPLVCLQGGDLVTLTAAITNQGAAAITATFSVTNLAPNLIGIPGSGLASVAPANFVITATSATWNGTLQAGETVTFAFKAQIAPNVASGTQLCVTSTATLNGGTPVTLTPCTRLACPTAGVAPSLSAQKPGSLLVFPYYTSRLATKADTRFTLSNIGATTAFVHLFFVDGASCQPTDQFLCLTPGASYAGKASETDGETTGWILAVAVNPQGHPIQANQLIGNAFVNDGEYVDTYGAEAFTAHSSLLAAVQGDTALLFLDGQGYDAVANQLAVEIQSPVNAPQQKVVTVGLRGDLNASTVSGAGQIGTGLLINGNEKPLGSFTSWLNGSCQAIATITAGSPRVPTGVSGMIPSGEHGTLQWRIGGGVGLLLTPRSAQWKGIRPLHKTGLTTASLRIPLFPPHC